MQFSLMHLLIIMWGINGLQSSWRNRFLIDQIIYVCINFIDDIRCISFGLGFLISF